MLRCGLLLCLLLAFAGDAQACEAMLGTEYTDPPEVARLELDERDWQVAFRRRTPDYATREYVVGSDTVQRWSELATWQVSFGARAGNLSDQKSRLLEALVLGCPGLQQRAELAPAGELRFEWWHSGCGAQPPRHELVRLVEGAIGIHSLTYARNGARIPDAERSAWWKRLADSRLALASRAADDPELHAARVALWRGDYAAARQRLEPLAARGVSTARVELAGLYAEGWGVPRDYARARELLEHAADQGDAQAEIRLGRMYEEGWGVSEDAARALAWYGRAAGRGDAEAQARAALVAMFGDVERIDYAGAARFLERAAAQGNPDALYWLGFAHERGLGVERDYTRAVALYRKAALAGEPNAQFRLGVAYEYGYGVTAQRDEAQKWYLRSALQGLELAQLALRDRFAR